MAEAPTAPTLKKLRRLRSGVRDGERSGGIGDCLSVGRHLGILISMRVREDLRLIWDSWPPEARPSAFDLEIDGLVFNVTRILRF